MSLIGGLITLVAFVPVYSSDLVQTFTYDVDVRHAVNEVDTLAMDWTLNYSARKPKSALSMEISARAKRLFDNADTDLNHASMEFMLRGHVHTGGLADQLPAHVKARYLELTDIPVEEQTKEQLDELDRLDNFIYKRPAYLFAYDIHYSIESTSELDKGAHVLGIGLTGEIPHLHTLIDIIPKALSTSRNSRFKPQPIRAYAGLEYTNQLTDMFLTGEIDDDDMWRSHFEIAWSTLIFNNMCVKLQWESDLFLSPPESIKERDREFNSLVRAELIIPVKSVLNIKITYIDGRLSPMYNLVSGTTFGLNVNVVK
jgi:hypothetical protein